MMQKEQWQGFEGRLWKEEINVRDFIQNNYTPYEGDSSFLADPTEATNQLWGKLQELQKEERAKGGVLDMETEVVSSLTAYGPGYICEELKDKEALTVINEVIIPALNIVGKDYETGKIFLPQLIQSAETTKKAFEVVKETFSANDGKEKAIGLSALMTTTVASMERTIKALHEAGCSEPIWVGGAVVTEDIAHNIGADYYTEDAMAAVNLLENEISDL